MRGVALTLIHANKNCSYGQGRLYYGDNINPVTGLIKLLFLTLDTSLVGLQERFSAMATKLELKYEEQYSLVSKMTSLFLTCDAYYVEICCQDNGYVATVKLAQANKQV